MSSKKDTDPGSQTNMEYSTALEIPTRPLDTLMLVFVPKVATLSALFTTQRSSSILEGVWYAEHATLDHTEFHCWSTFSVSETQLYSVLHQTPSHRHPLWSLAPTLFNNLCSSSWTKPTFSYQRCRWGHTPKKAFKTHTHKLYFSLCIKVTI